MSQSDTGRETFLLGEAHWCDICDQPFDTLKELANHECALADGGQSTSETDRWWVITNFSTDPCCNAPNIATNGKIATCQTCGWKADYDELNRYRDTEPDHDIVTDGGRDIEDGTPTARIREARTQLTLALRDVDNPDVERFARGAIAQAESASVALEGVQNVGGLDELMITRDGAAATVVLGPRPDTVEEECGWQ